LILNN